MKCEVEGLLTGFVPLEEEATEISSLPLCPSRKDSEESAFCEPGRDPSPETNPLGP